MGTSLTSRKDLRGDVPTALVLLSGRGHRILRNMWERSCVGRRLLLPVDGLEVAVYENVQGGFPARRRQEVYLCPRFLRRPVNQSLHAILAHVTRLCAHCAPIADSQNGRRPAMRACHSRVTGQRVPGGCTAWRQGEREQRPHELQTSKMTQITLINGTDVRWCVECLHLYALQQRAREITPITRRRH